MYKKEMELRHFVSRFKLKGPRTESSNSYASWFLCFLKRIVWQKLIALCRANVPEPGVLQAAGTGSQTLTTTGFLAWRQSLQTYTWKDTLLNSQLANCWGTDSINQHKSSQVSKMCLAGSFQALPGFGNNFVKIGPSPQSALMLMNR